MIIADLQIDESAIQLDESILFHRCDVSKWSDLDGLIKASLNTYGDVPDIYVAGAGVFEPVSGIVALFIFYMLNINSNRIGPIFGMTPKTRITKRSK